MTMRMSIPVKERTPALSFADRAVASWRLFIIEMHRSPAVLAALAIAGITAWLIRDQLPVGVVRWREINDFASDAMMPASAIAAGIGAFLARRDERRRLDDQLVQTSIGSPGRDVVGIIAAIAWCLCGYLAVVAGFFLYAALNATWGGPEWTLVALTAVSIVLGVSLGWLVGVVFRSRFSPLVALAVTLGLISMYQLTVDLRRSEMNKSDGETTFTHQESSIKFLSPFELLDFHDLRSIMVPGLCLDPRYLRASRVRRLVVSAPEDCFPGEPVSGGIGLRRLGGGPPRE